MNLYLEVLLRTLLFIIVILILCRINGPKLISQMTYYDYIVGISAGSIAASICIDKKISIWAGLIGIVLFMLSSIVFSFFSSKSISMRRLMTGSPIFLIARGKILYDGLKKSHFDINDLLRQLRTMGYFDVNQINYAILETNGTVSVMPKSMDRPATAAESNIQLPEDSIIADVIIDGKIMKNNLKAMGKNEDWLIGQIKKQNYKLKDIILGCLDVDGNLYLYKKEKGTTLQDIFQ